MYIESTLEAQGARPPRKMLRLTSAGDAVLRQGLAAPVKHGRDFRLEFLAKLAFAVEHGEQAVATLLEQQRKACRAWVTELSNELRRVPSDRQFERLVLEFRLSQLRAITAWLRTCEQTLAPSHE